MKKAVAIGLASLLSLTVFLASASPTFAQAAAPKPPPGATKEEFLNKQIEERNKAIEAAQRDRIVNQESHTENTLDQILKGLICQTAGEYAGCKQINEKGEEVSSGGALGTAVSWNGNMYENPPATTATYVASVMQDLRMAPPAYAQGLGFSALSPILTIWETMRNIAYFFFVAAFIVIGFMIMFRQKISGQAVVTAQQAIPQIIIALITVTFSYAIAGLLIDGMYLIMFLVAGLFGKADLIDGNVFQIAKRLIDQNTAGAGANALGELVRSAIGEGAFGLIGQLVTTVAAAVIILLVIVFNTFKLFFALLRVYVELILSIAFGPVILMTGAIPGQNPFGGWIRNIVGNLAVFPAILLLLIVFDVIRDATTASTSGGFLPPYVAGYSAPEVLPLLAGTALIMALPNVVEETKKAFGVQTGGFFGNLLQAGIKNAQERRKLGTEAVIAPFRSVAGAAIGAREYQRFGLKNSRQGALAGALVGAYGPRRATRQALRAVNQYGEFAENAPGFANDLELFAVEATGGRALNFVNFVRQRTGKARGGIISYNPVSGKADVGTQPNVSPQQARQVAAQQANQTAAATGAPPASNPVAGRRPS